MTDKYNTQTCDNCACNKVCNHDLFGFENCGNWILDKTVSEAIKEFTERLKSSIYIDTNLLVYQCEAVESMIDDIVKEMVGDNK